jgi:hypothetical protein
MYISYGPSDQGDDTRFHGFFGDIPDVQFQKSLAAIQAALELNPRTGYVKGGPPRKKLEEAFESVPPVSALDLTQRLLQNEGPLERLFRYRLHPATQGAILKGILLRKAEEELNRKREEAHRRELERTRIIEELRQKVCANMKARDRLIEDLCRRTGEGSEQCRNFRSQALKAREELRMENIRCP